MAAKISPKIPRNSDFSPKGRFVLLGGFLGAGKTSCMVSLAKWLIVNNLRPALITNDQGDGLVDTSSALTAAGGAAGREVRQVSGGCFCCRAGELGKALLELETSVQPDVFIAEPVGSCTDLVATVLLPLEKIYPSGIARAPMSVILDAKRVWSLYFGQARSLAAGFSKDVRYIFLKQMEEAEILVVNKTDLLKVKELGRVVRRLQEDFPGKRVLSVSARSGAGMEAWFTLLLGESSSPSRVMEVDYRRYGEGEALLGWYNARLRLSVPHGEVDGNALLSGLALKIQENLEAAGVEIAHFKMSLQGTDVPPKGNPDDLAVVHVVRNGGQAEFSRKLTARISTGDLLVNLRAEGKPALLKKTVRAEFKDLPLGWIEEAAFRPGIPKPAHRVKEVI